VTVDNDRLCENVHIRQERYLLVALTGGQSMRRPTLNEAGRRPASAGSRDKLHGKEAGERDGRKENASRIPMPMMLIISAMMGANSD